MTVAKQFGESALNAVGAFCIILATVAFLLGGIVTALGVAVWAVTNLSLIEFGVATLALGAVSTSTAMGVSYLLGKME